MISCSRVIEFDAAHRVIGHQNKCKYLHGHRYRIEAFFTASELNNLGMVIDFGEIKSILGEWIDSNWDHSAILCEQDLILGQNIENITKQKIYYLPYNPTAENMVKYLFYNICPNLFKNKSIICNKIRLYETPNCYVEIE